MSLLDLPGCIMKCDVCGHEPIECWAKGFGCNLCKGAKAVLEHSIQEPKAHIAKVYRMTTAVHVDDPLCKAIDKLR